MNLLGMLTVVFGVSWSAMLVNGESNTELTYLTIVPGSQPTLFRSTIGVFCTGNDLAIVSWVAYSALLNVK